MCICLCILSYIYTVLRCPTATPLHNCYRFANSAEANGPCKAVLAGKMLKGSSRRMGAIIIFKAQ